MSWKDSYNRWLGCGTLTDEQRTELRGLDEKELKERFLGSLEFGTAGLRGKMGMGTAMMNEYVVRHATQAFAQVILEESGAKRNAGVCICHDCRINSRLFAECAASVMAANGIHVRIFDDMRPTPELSFAVRHYGAAAGINVTASHNPKEYNGYKVYWSDGAQLPPAHADKIAAIMAEIDIFDGVKTMDFEEARRNGLISIMGQETDEAFLKEVLAMAGDYAPDELDRSFKIVYTPFHGTGYKLIPYVLRKIGVENLYCVEEQMITDGSFPTVKSPNPENPEGFELAVRLADRVGADFIIGSDPDADRVGMMIRKRDGKFYPITGNLAGVLLFDYFASSLERQGKMPETPVLLKTIVTTEMARAAAEKRGVACYDTFTGFKFMAEKKQALEDSGQGNVVFSYEESYGYMVGGYVRDKDAVTAAMLLCEMAMWYSKRGMTVEDIINAAYEKLGFYKEKTVSLYMEGLEGAAKIKGIMEFLRANPPKKIASAEVEDVRDYLSGECRSKAAGEISKMELAGANVLRYTLSDGTAVIVRPSGTEPKIKIYILAKGKSLEYCDKTIELCSNWANALPEACR